MPEELSVGLFMSFLGLTVLLGILPVLYTRERIKKWWENR